MSKPQILNSDQHRGVRVITSRGAEYGESVHVVPVIADELGRLVLDYPVCLMKDPNTGQFGLYALTGLEPGENLYLRDDAWDASYVPLHVRRQPFMVGLQSNGGDGGSADDALITIDMDSKRVQRAQGELLFNDDGTKTPYLDSVSELLGRLMAGIQSTEAMVQELAERDLVEPITVNVTLPDAEPQSYDGLYTVSDEKLQALDAGALADLNGRGYLQASYLLLASIGHIRKLMERKSAIVAASRG